ncbi:hypothetical protein BJX70DRAFT_364849 [Aspergillus crustosus]
MTRMTMSCVLTHVADSTARDSSPIDTGLQILSPPARLEYSVHVPWLSFHPHIHADHSLGSNDIIVVPRCAHCGVKQVLNLQPRRAVTIMWHVHRTAVSLRVCA